MAGDRGGYTVSQMWCKGRLWQELGNNISGDSKWAFYKNYWEPGFWWFRLIWNSKCSFLRSLVSRLSSGPPKFIMRIHPGPLEPL